MLKQTISFECEKRQDIAAIVTSADQAPFIALSMFIKNVEIMRTHTCVSPLELENKALKERIKVLEAEIVQLNARLALLEKQADLDFTTSSKPPSTDFDWKKRPPISNKTDKEPKSKGG